MKTTAKLIESLDRQRYSAVVLQAVSLLCIVMADILSFCLFKWGKEAFANFRFGWETGNITADYIFVLGVGILFYASLVLLIGAIVWYVTIECRIARRKELRAALYNEMYLAHRRQSQRIALWVVMCALLVCVVMEVTYAWLRKETDFRFYGMIFYLGMASLQLSWLILNRNRR
jgi:hypothetical protein